MKLIVGSMFVLALPFAVANADRPPQHHRPPQAAFDACASAKAGDTCSVTLRDHAITGVCRPVPDGSALVCHPDHPPGPPPEAISACSGLAEGAACTIRHDGHEVSGTCAKGPDSTTLACRPSHAPPPPPPQ